MNKLYVDEILKNASNQSPGPDRYNLETGFGGKLGERYSMRPKNDPEVSKL